MRENKGQMQCPACATETLESHRVIRSSDGAEVELDRCPCCDGVWYDTGELHQLIALAEEEVNVPKAANAVGKPCPRCEGKLFSFNYPQTFVTIDACKKCGGMWVGKDELREIYMVRHHLADRKLHPDFGETLVALYESMEEK